MTRAQRLRSCINLLQLADTVQNRRARVVYLAQLGRTLGRLKKKNDHLGSYPEMIAH